MGRASAKGKGGRKRSDDRSKKTKRAAKAKRAAPKKARKVLPPAKKPDSATRAQVRRAVREEKATRKIKAPEPKREPEPIKAPSMLPSQSSKPAAPPRAARPRGKFFVSNAELLQEVIKSKGRLRENPALMASAMTARLAEMLMLMVEKYSTKHNFSGYSYLDEMKGDALSNLCNKWHKFDEVNYTNPFAYYTQIIHTCFLGSLGKEKKVQKIRDRILVSHGRTPSMGAQVDADLSWQNLGDDGVPDEPVDAAAELNDWRGERVEEPDFITQVDAPMPEEPEPEQPADEEAKGTAEEESDVFQS
jgi:hypothetical protein